MGRVAAQPVGQTESIANRLPEGRAKRVNPRLTAIFKEELVRKYGLFFRMLHSLAGISPRSRFLLHLSRVAAWMRLIMPDFFIKSRQILRSRLQVMTFIAVYSFSSNQQRKPSSIAQSCAVCAALHPVMMRLSKECWPGVVSPAASRMVCNTGV